MSRLSTACLVTATAIILSLAAPARASVVGTIFSGAATGDPASIYHNPAAMTLMRGTNSLLFGAVSAIRLDYQRDALDAATGEPLATASTLIPKPNVIGGVVTDAGLERFRFGIGATIPLIDGASWAAEYGGRPSSTRYYALDARLMHVMIEPAAAFRINRFISLGVGLDIVGVFLSQEAMVDLGAKVNQMACAINEAADCPLDAPLPREDPTYQGLTTIDGSGWGVGVFGGVLVTPAPWIRLGAGFHSGAGSVNIPVEMSVQLPPAVTDYVEQNLPAVTLPELTAEGNVSTTSPMSVTAAISVDVRDDLELSADLHWMDYSETSLLIGAVTQSDQLGLIGDQIIIKARTDFFLFGLRGAYQVHPSVRLALRFEYEVNNRPERYVTPMSIDFHKFSIHAGVAWSVTPWLRITGEYGHYFMPQRRITRSFFGPQASPVTPEEEGFDKPPPTGLYSVAADRVGLGVALSF